MIAVRASRSRYRGSACYACLDFDGDPGGAVAGAGDPSVRILDFCTTPDCVAVAQATLDAEGFGSIAAPVPFDAATDGRDHWLAPGEPHCADCHQAPFVEQSGNINAFPPFNYPRKASLMRYSRGHQDITCQGCHESIHGLYPVSPTIDSTSYAQAASLNPDGSHGPLKCGTCHETDNADIPLWIRNGLSYNGQRVDDIDTAIQWMHTFTDEASVLQPGGVCENCHKDRSNKIAEDVRQVAASRVLRSCRPQGPGHLPRSRHWATWRVIRLVLTAIRRPWMTTARHRISPTVCARPATILTKVLRRVVS